MITFRYVSIFSNVSVKFGELESSLVDPDKSFVKGMLIKQKKWHRCKMKPQHGLNVYFSPVTTFKCFKID